MSPESHKNATVDGECIHYCHLWFDTCCAASVSGSPRKGPTMRQIGQVVVPAAAMHSISSTTREQTVRKRWLSSYEILFVMHHCEMHFVQNGCPLLHLQHFLTPLKLKQHTHTHTNKQNNIETRWLPRCAVSTLWTKSVPRAVHLHHHHHLYHRHHPIIIGRLYPMGFKTEKKEKEIHQCWAVQTILPHDMYREKLAR